MKATKDGTTGLYFLFSFFFRGICWLDQCEVSKRIADDVDLDEVRSGWSQVLWPRLFNTICFILSQPRWHAEFAGPLLMTGIRSSEKSQEIEEKELLHALRTPGW